MRDVTLSEAVLTMARGDAGTLIIGKRAVVYMPRWFYVTALVGLFVAGLLLGLSLCLASFRGLS